jgi:4-hydroxy-3-polyprenylbenzoate decarboxylase
MAKELDVPFFDIDDLFAPPSSGSYRLDGLVILPCSMGSVGRIASGISSNLLERASDVMLKERKQLIICPRETPLNSIHLENMLKLSRCGVNIVPTSTAFYYKPKTIEDIIDFHIGKVLDILGINHSLFKRWGAV